MCKEWPDQRESSVYIKNNSELEICIFFRGGFKFFSIVKVLYFLIYQIVTYLFVVSFQHPPFIFAVSPTELGPMDLIHFHRQNLPQLHVPYFQGPHFMFLHLKQIYKVLIVLSVQQTGTVSTAFSKSVQEPCLPTPSSSRPTEASVPKRRRVQKKNSILELMRKDRQNYRSEMLKIHRETGV